MRIESFVLRLQLPTYATHGRGQTVREGQRNAIPIRCKSTLREMGKRQVSSGPTLHPATCGSSDEDGLMIQAQR